MFEVNPRVCCALISPGSAVNRQTDVDGWLGSAALMKMVDFSINSAC